MSTIKTGTQAEQIACAHLQTQGLKSITNNFRCKLGEIDLIMLDHDYLVFVEVRYRKSTFFGTGAETVDIRKQSKLIRTAQIYLQQQRKNHYPCRFDVISITGPLPIARIDWIKNAFQI